ncbi:hypothetical protein N7478_001463 [Penicillium angulare]|uniref:uncharacterized protein n=1 Tax=Penicillium angulare TaxID=116970 RepID=UPI00253F71CA|nr:uncharacterized protein N7478_001463 [Penicillium angulare]KAJ5292212.1 hypothetical protein N7478_001463 [Penicillium angulare]
MPVQRTARRPRGTEVPPSQTTRRPPTSTAGLNPTARRPQPQQAPPTNQRNQQHAAATDNSRDLGDDFDLVHAHCRVAINNAELHNRQLTARLNERQREIAASSQRLSREKAQASVQLHQLSSEKQRALEESSRLKKEIVQLNNRLDTVVNETHNLISRTEVQDMLNEIHASAETFMKSLTTRVSDNENVQLSGQLPASDVVHDPWMNQYGPLGGTSAAGISLRVSGHRYRCIIKLKGNERAHLAAGRDLFEDRQTAWTLRKVQPAQGSLTSDIDKYLDSQPVSWSHHMIGDADEEWVLKWWRANEFNFPLMAKAARDYLAIPSAEVGIEREFSNARDVLGLRRHCLNAETMRWLMLLKERYSA